MPTINKTISQHAADTNLKFSFNDKHQIRTEILKRGNEHEPLIVSIRTESNQTRAQLETSKKKKETHIYTKGTRKNCEIAIKWNNLIYLICAKVSRWATDRLPGGHDPFCNLGYCTFDVLNYIQGSRIESPVKFNGRSFEQFENFTPGRLLRIVFCNPLSCK